MLETAVVHAPSLADHVTHAVALRGLDHEHGRYMDRYLAHGRTEAALIDFVLSQDPTLLPHSVNHSDLAAGAQLHDIGKPFVTEGDATLFDRAHLSEHDIVKIRNHPEAGAIILTAAMMIEKFSISETVTDIVSMHHERLDGSGYPNHLRGDQIPPYVQFFSVVDTLVSMAEGPQFRPYKDRGSTLAESQVMMFELVELGQLNGIYVERVFEALVPNYHLYLPQLAFFGPL